MTTRSAANSAIDAVPKIEIIALGEEHLAALAALERECFSQPWSQDALRLLTGDNAIAAVALCDGEVAAYGGMTCVLDEGQITNIATLPRFRRLGLARAVLCELIRRAEERGIGSVFLEARASNLPAISLYESCGFCRIGVRRRFYSAPVEDAVMMELRL